MKKRIKIEIPSNCDDFYSLVNEYCYRTNMVRRDYYKHITTKEERNASYHESLVVSDDGVYWKLLEDTLTVKNPNYGCDNFDSIFVSLINLTNNCESIELDNGDFYGVINILNTPKGSEYKNIDENNLKLIPYILDNRRYDLRKICYMVLLKK